MVQTYRSTSKATATKDVSPMRRTAVHKSTLSVSPSSPGLSSNFGLSARLIQQTAASPRADKWKYNAMVQNQRDEFNNLHFC